MCRAVFDRAICAVRSGAAILALVASLELPVLGQSSTVQPIEWPPTQDAFSALPETTNSLGPRAILVRNPGLVPGTPPFALADHSGRVLRYVEPAAGADLESHLGQMVRVRHDTGGVLLSSQLEFLGAGNNRHAIRQADFETTGGDRAGGTIAPIGIVAEEIAVPLESEPIWLDEMEASPGAPTGNCNCEPCLAARGPSHRGLRDSGFGWDCCICEALFGKRRTTNEPSCAAGYAAACGSTCCDMCGCGGGDCWTNVRPGLIGMAEILFLRGYDSDPDSVNSKQHETGSRYELGYMNETGRSWRVRYFEFEHPDFDDGRFLQLDYWDLEYAGRFTLGPNWRGELGGGLRLSKVDDQGGNRYDDALGPVVGAQLHGLGCGNLETYGIVRQSFQFGREDRRGNYGTFAISEMQLGLTYQDHLCGGNGFARAFIEGQSWQGLEDAASQDVGLFGFGFALGLTR